MSSTLLDQYVARLQAMPSFNIYQVMPDGSVAPWYEVTGPMCVPDLVIRQANLEDQVAAISAQITHWGRMTAQAQRVWEIEDRFYRVWRDRKCIELMTPDGDKDWKKPTGEQLERLYRTDAEYAIVYARVERAHEAMESAKAVLDGFRAKKDMMAATVRRWKEGGAATMQV